MHFELDSLQSNLTMHQKGPTWLKCVMVEHIKNNILTFLMAIKGNDGPLVVKHSMYYAAYQGNGAIVSISISKILSSVLSNGERMYFWQLCMYGVIDCDIAEQASYTACT